MDAVEVDDTRARFALFREVLETHRTVQVCNIGDDFQFEVLDGSYINEVYKVFDKSSLRNHGNAVVIKHALPYIKFLGPRHLFGTRRLHVEHEALTLFDDIAHGLCPKPIFYDSGNNIVCMEYLSGYESLRQGLMEGTTRFDTAENLAQSLSQFHGQTHVDKIGMEELSKLDQIFSNSEMLHFHENYLFLVPLDRNTPQHRCVPVVKDMLEEVYENTELLASMENVRRTFMETKDCLIHGDLHSGSIMLKGASVKILDLETVRVGPLGYDVAMVIAYFIMVYHRHMAVRVNTGLHEKFAHSMIRACKLFINTYFNHTDVFQTESSKSRLVREIAGFIGCHYLKITLSVCTDFLKGEDVNPKAESNTLRAGVRLLEKVKEITNIQSLVNIATKF